MLEKIKFVVKLILYDMKIRCYITLKKGNQREQNPSLLRGSQALKPLRYNALLEKKALTKGYINNFINFESIFLENS